MLKIDGTSSRRSFISSLTATSAALLAGCSANTLPNANIFTANNERENLYQLMRKCGVYEVAFPGNTIVLPEWQDKLRPVGGTTPQGCPLPLSTTGKKSILCDTTQPPPTIITVYANGYGSASVTGASAGPGFYRVSGSYTGNYFGGSKAGPVYTTGQPSNNCIGETFSAAGAMATSIGAWLKANEGKVAPNIEALWAGYAAGELAAIEVIATLLGIATVGDLLLILGGIAVTVGAIYVLVKCLRDY